jgi:hypothetical protein
MVIRLCTAEVRGSNPLGSTQSTRCFCWYIAIYTVVLGCTSDPWYGSRAATWGALYKLSARLPSPASCCIVVKGNTLLRPTIQRRLFSIVYGLMVLSCDAHKWSLDQDE